MSVFQWLLWFLRALQWFLLLSQTLQTSPVWTTEYCFQKASISHRNVLVNLAQTKAAIPRLAANLAARYCSKSNNSPLPLLTETFGISSSMFYMFSRADSTHLQEGNLIYFTSLVFPQASEFKCSAKRLGEHPRHWVGAQPAPWRQVPPVSRSPTSSSTGGSKLQQPGCLSASRDIQTLTSSLREKYTRSKREVAFSNWALTTLPENKREASLKSY